MSRPARASIDTAALEHNLQRVRQLSPNSRIMAVVKANAYGHGLSSVGCALAGADGFGVASLEEALALEAAGIDGPVTVLEGFFDASELPYFIRNGFATVIHSPWQLNLLEQYAGEGRIDVWLKIDTGMNRLGFPLRDVPGAIERLQRCRHAGELRLMSHLARADEPDSAVTRGQIESFRSLVEQYQLSASLANSAGIIAWPDSEFDWQRPGIMLYGSSPVQGRSADALGLRAVMTASSALIAINERQKGDAIGYGGTWVCPEVMPVGVVAFGYGDGYPRHAAVGTPVLINGKLAPLIGRVSMDMVTVDLREHHDARVGDEAVLWGRGLPVDTVASHAETISYELLCHVTDRVPRLVSQ